MIENTWLASYPKSGNTWVRALYAAYLTGHCDINALFCSVADSYPYAFQRVSPKPLAELETWEWAALSCAASMQLPHAIREKPLLIKTHHANLMPYGYRVIPTHLCKRAIYLLRDPRDVAISFARHLGGSVDQTIDLMGDEEACIESDGRPPQFICSWGHHVTSWLHPKSGIDVLAVHYSDLVSDTVPTFTEILRFMGENPNQDRVKKAVEMASLDKLQGQEKADGFSEASKHATFFSTGGSKWRTILSNDQINRIAADHGKVMNMLGYTVLEAA